ncbi:MAG: methyltransferase [Lentisphaerae bacterium]|nr:methyltransferase [Lentisphaerota bacterium]
MIFPEFPEVDFIIRLCAAGLLGACIGIERELRAKEAGIRTHFLVALGSALMMIVSQHGFGDLMPVIGYGRFDPSRVAAQIVSGIGFLGAGIIIFRKETVQGLTTAAGLWVAAGIGMAIGGGMYVLGMAATVLALICFELLRLSSAHLGLISRSVHVTFSTKSENSLSKIIALLPSKGFSAGNYSFQKENDGIRVKMVIRYRARRNDSGMVLRRLEKIPGIKLEKFE